MFARSLAVVCLLACVSGIGCDSPEGPVGPDCGLRVLPNDGDSTGGLVIRRVLLSCYADVVAAKVEFSDDDLDEFDQGSEQELSIYRENSCGAPSIEHSTGWESGNEIDFGAIVRKTNDAPLYEQICDRDDWPVHIIIDLGGFFAGNVAAEVEVL